MQLHRKDSDGVVKEIHIMERDSNGYKLYKNGDKTWKNPAGQYHRTDGHAIKYADGSKQWWYKGKHISKKEYYSKDFQVKIVMES
jgi:hypothetical protein